MVTLCAGLLTAAAFTEIQNATERYLKTTKFKKLIKQNPALLWIETGTMVLICIEISFVVGPITGGALYGELGIEKAAIGMAIFGGAICLIFVMMGICISPSDIFDKEKKEKDEGRIVL